MNKNIGITITTNTQAEQKPIDPKLLAEIKALTLKVSHKWNIPKTGRGGSKTL